MQLFLLPFAGGSGTAFVKLAPFIDERIDAVVMEYAGRGGRKKEPFITEYNLFLEDVAKCINARWNGLPYAILGYSMGSMLTFDLLTRRMIDERSLRHAFICAKGSLRQISSNLEYRKLSDSEFAQRIADLGGIDNRILKNKRFLDIYMKPIRADYEILGQYVYIEDGYKIPCDVTVMYSERDVIANGVENWVDYSLGEVDFYEMGDNHFFINQHYQKMAEIINKHLEKYLI